jgi:hypothetical protein
MRTPRWEALFKASSSNFSAFEDGLDIAAFAENPGNVALAE